MQNTEVLDLRIHWILARERMEFADDLQCRVLVQKGLGVQPVEHAHGEARRNGHHHASVHCSQRRHEKGGVRCETEAVNSLEGALEIAETAPQAAIDYGDEVPRRAVLRQPVVIAEPKRQIL